MTELGALPSSVVYLEVLSPFQVPVRVRVASVPPGTRTHTFLKTSGSVHVRLSPSTTSPLVGSVVIRLPSRSTKVTPLAPSTLITSSGFGAVM